MMELKVLPAALIAAPERIRDVDKKKAAEIAESIREIGLLSPIIVKPGTRIRNGTPTPGWDILAGNHRFEAMFGILNWREIPCVVTDVEGLRAELFSIDENLVRHELSDAQRAWQTARRKEIYEALHPEAALGGVGRGQKKVRQNGEPSMAERFTASTASASGRSERAVQRDAERGQKLGSTLNRIAGTTLDRGVEIDALAALPPEEREHLVSRAEKGERVSARKQASQPANVVKLDADEMQAKTVARRLMTAYLNAPYRAQRLFDDLYQEHLTAPADSGVQ